MPNIDWKKVDDMLSLVTVKHEGQLYGEEDYIYHLLCVRAKALTLYGYSEDLILTALGHDLLEDTDCEEYDILSICGVEVLNAIKALTKSPTDTLETYIERVRCNPLAVKIKFADALSNLEHSIIDDNSRRIKKYLKTLSLLDGVK